MQQHGCCMSETLCQVKEDRHEKAMWCQIPFIWNIWKMGNNKDNVNQWFPGAENKRWTVETVE